MRMKINITTPAKKSIKNLTWAVCLLAPCISLKGSLEWGPVKIGGALRANYIIGDYDREGASPSRGGNGGDFEFDTFRINLDLQEGPWLGKLEYRWYNGYNFLHTGWVGYQYDDALHIEIGVNRVPFGPGPYGNSNSWFFDQHYYVGLADDMDLGLKLSYASDRLRWDVAYYVSSEGSWRGGSADSARYSYDVVRWNLAVADDGTVDFTAPLNGFRESHQLNLRAILTLLDGSLATDAGASLQYAHLRGTGTENGDMYAASVHMRNTWQGFALGTQLSYYTYNIATINPWGTDELLPMGAYDFAWPVAARAWIPSIALSYFYEPENLEWLDSITSYIEYSSIVKRASGFNNSELLVIGAAWARGGWYIYTDLAWSNGNYFVGDIGDDYSKISGVGDFGVNGNNRWNYRFNINFGYYF